MTKDRDYKSFLILFGILIIAFFLRINQWFNFLGADEIRIMGWVEDLNKNPFPIHPYPPLFLYINFLFSIILKKIFLFLGIINFDIDFWQSNIGFITTLKAGRILTTIFGTLNVYMVYRITKDFINKKAALISSAILAVCWPHVIDSHNFKSDMLLALLFSLMVYFILKFLDSGALRFLAIGSFLFGLSFAAKYNGFFGVIIILIAIFIKRKDIGIFKGFAYFSISSLIGFLTGAPNWIVHPISNFKSMMKLLHDLSNELVWYDKFPSSYILYGKNLIETFGWVLIIILIAGLLLSFIKKNRVESLISITFIFYFMMIGRENYLNYRAIHILFVLASIIIGKFIFSDIKFLIKNKTINTVAVVSFTIIVLGFTFINLGRSYKSLNLLNSFASHATKERPGIGNHDYSAYYLKNHLEYGSLFFREMWTPPVNSLGVGIFGTDVTRVPLHKFRGDKSFNYLLTSFRTDYIIRKGKNKKFFFAAKKRLENYIPFYKVYRPRIFTWSNDIQFWYKKPAFIKKKIVPDSQIKLPRTLYSDEKNPSIFLPLQRYEKNPCSGKIQNGKFTKHIVSKIELSSISFNFLNKKLAELTININGKSYETKLSEDKFIKHISLENFKPKTFKGIGLRRLWEVSMDKEGLETELFIYKIEISSHSKSKIPFVFQPVYSRKEPISKIPPYPLVSKAGNSNPSDSLDNVKSSDWIKMIYKKTGVDFNLLSKINSLSLFKNTKNSTNNIDTGYFPLSHGTYFLNLEMKEIVNGVYPEKKGKIVIQRILNKNKITEYDLKKGQFKFPLNEEENFGFYRIKIIDASKANLLIKNVKISIDFPTYINKNFLIK